MEENRQVLIRERRTIGREVASQQWMPLLFLRQTGIKGFYLQLLLCIVALRGSFEDKAVLAAQCFRRTDSEALVAGTDAWWVTVLLCCGFNGGTVGRLDGWFMCLRTFVLRQPRVFGRTLKIQLLIQGRVSRYRS